MSAAMYYGYTDRVPRVWHIAVDNKSARNKFKMDFHIIKPHFIETSRLNIGVDDVIVPGEVKRTVTTRLEGFKEPNIYTYSLESTMAETFDAILKRMTASSRVKDFYDIYYWSQVFDFEGRGLQKAIFETLQHRGTLYEKDSMEQIRAFDQNEFLRKLWNIYNPGPGIEKPDFSSVLVQIDRFISPVYGALLRGDEFFVVWSSKENVWK